MRHEVWKKNKSRPGTNELSFPSYKQSILHTYPPFACLSPSYIVKRKHTRKHPPTFQYKQKDSSQINSSFILPVSLKQIHPPKNKNCGI